MRHYHGTPLGGTRESVARFVITGNRHFLVPFPNPDDLSVIAESSCGFCVDNGAFSAWRSGKPVTDWGPYYDWCTLWCRHPRWDFAVVPDVIGGCEEENDLLVEEWFARTRLDDGTCAEGAPVWHLHESFDRLNRLMADSRIICLGSSGEYQNPGTTAWHDRMAKAMDVLCDSTGSPRRKIHGLRMLDPAIVARYPLFSADSTNVAQNSQLLGRYGMYKPPTQAQRREVLAARIETTRSPGIWVPAAKQEELFSLE